MKMSIGVTIMSVLFVVGVADAVCCGRTKMVWAADICTPYQNDYYMQHGGDGDITAGIIAQNHCQAKVCGDGRVGEGTFCGKGKCNMVGCDCDEGCIKGNAAVNFRRISGISNAEMAEFSMDPSTWLPTNSEGQ